MAEGGRGGGLGGGGGAQGECMEGWVGRKNTPIEPTWVVFMCKGTKTPEYFQLQYSIAPHLGLLLAVRVPGPCFGAFQHLANRAPVYFSGK